MKTKDYFNKDRYIALIIILCGSIMTWYTLILFTKKKTDTIFDITRTQISGCILALIVGIALWLRRCLTIKPNNK